MPNTVYHSGANYLECLICRDAVELKKATGSNPEVLMQVREQYETQHANCHLKDSNAPQIFLTESQARKRAGARETALRVLGR